MKQAKASFPCPPYAPAQLAALPNTPSDDLIGLGNFALTARYGMPASYQH